MTSNNLMLSIVLPAYEEGKNLNELLPRITKTLQAMKLSYEILVIDTLQPLDNTPQICEENNVRYITRRNGNNFGDAIRTGISEALGESILFMDADGSHTPEFIPTLYSHAQQFDVVIASRYVDSGGTENNPLLVGMSKIVNWTFSKVLNLPCKDVSNSFKIYRASQLKQVKLTCNNFDIVEEILFKLRRNKPQMQFKEVPFIFKQRMFGETKRNLLTFILTYIYTILKLRFRT
jgi:dolichol-phosphate mannosyltransferase